MKTERRHELQTNQLADRLGHWIEQIKARSSTLILGLVVFVVVVIAATILRNQSVQKTANAWDEFYAKTSGYERDPEEIRIMAHQHRGTAVEEWGMLARADEQLRRGEQSILAEKTVGRRYLNEAATEYRQLIDSATNEVIRGQATYGLAVALESLGQLDEAVKQYKAVRGGLAEVADARATQIEGNEQIKEFYDWFAVAERSLPPVPPGRGVPGRRPDFPVDEPAGLPRDLGSLLEDFPNTNDAREPANLGGEPAPGDAPQPDRYAPAESPADPESGTGGKPAADPPE